MNVSAFGAVLLLVATVEKAETGLCVVKALEPARGDAGPEDAEGVCDSFAENDHLMQRGRFVEEVDVWPRKVQI